MQEKQFQRVSFLKNIKRTAYKHYRLALRQLSDDGHLDVAYTDCSKHRVSVKLEDYCILTFK